MAIFSFSLLVLTVFRPMRADSKEPLLSEQRKAYLGKKLGDLTAGKRGVSGTLYAATGKHLVIEDFSYNGTAPDAYFMMGTSSQPSKHGTIFANEAGSKGTIPAYSKQTIVLTVPGQAVVTDFKWFSVYRKDAEISIGDVAIPSNFDYPRERTIGSSLSGAHKTHAAEVVLKDVKTLFLKDFSYDGSAPDAFFLCGKGSPNPNGTKIPDEKGSLEVIRGYVHEDVTLTLPGDLTVFDIDWFAVYCITYIETFISVTIPKNPNVPPLVEVLKSQKEWDQSDGSDFDNCETIIPNRIQVAWKLKSNSVLFQLSTKLVAKQWAAFGVSGDKDKNQMIGGDVAIVYLEGPLNKAKLVDYYLGSKAQCSNTSGGVCPDVKSSPTGTDDLTMVSSKYENGLLKVVYYRPLAAIDRYDKAITPTGETAVIAAQGPMAEDPPDVVLYHTMYVTRTKTTLKLSRPAKKNCQPLTASRPREETMDERQFGGRDILRREGVIVFTARIGPTGGSRGYAKITGKAGWGIAWWINDELIPVLHVERGKTYTFVAQGGHNQSNSARYHPFYITDSKKGGGSQEDVKLLGKPGHLLLAGVTMDPKGKADVSQAVGRYCEWEHKSVDQSDVVKTFSEFMTTLELQCEPNVKSGTFTWTPDEKTPDTVYYQCFTHFYLGWKIAVKNPGDPDEPLDAMPGSARTFDSALLMTSLLVCVTLRLSTRLTIHQ
ncbi:protein Skeletor, isoforms B/C-like [Ixodes scapularis]